MKNRRQWEAQSEKSESLTYNLPSFPTHILQRRKQTVNVMKRRRVEKAKSEESRERSKIRQCSNFGSSCKRFRRLITHLPGMWPFCCSVRHYHLSETSPIKQRSVPHFIPIKVLYCRKYDSFSMIEPDVELPILPLDFVSVQFEADTLGLCDLERFNICSNGPVFPSMYDRSNVRRLSGYRV